MSDASAAAPKMSLWKTLLFGALGIVAIVGGIAKLRGGLQDIFGSGDIEALTKLVQDSDAAATQAAEHDIAANDKFNALIGTLNAEPLDTLRADHRAEVEEARQECQNAADQSRRAVQNLDEAIAIGVKEKWEEYFKLRIEAFNALAKCNEIKRDALDVMLDESLTDKDAVIEKINELITQADVAAREAIAKFEKAGGMVQELDAA